MLGSRSGAQAGWLTRVCARATFFRLHEAVSLIVRGTQQYGRAAACIVLSHLGRRRTASAKHCQQPGLPLLCCAVLCRVTCCREDSMGNIFGRWEGSDPSLGSVLTGSHCDAIPLAGMYDGTLGVIGAIEALATLRRAVRAGC
jgi:hypothetical protein